MSNTVKERIMEYARANPGGFPVPDVAEAVGTTASRLSSDLTYLVRNGKLERYKRGHYKATSNGHVKERPRATKSQLDTMRQHPSNGDLFEYLGTSANGKLILRELENGTLIVGEPLNV